MISGAPAGGTAAALDALTFADLRPAWDAAPALIVVTVGPDHVVAYQNTASEQLFGGRQVGVPIGVAFPEFTAAATAMADRVRREGVTITSPPAPARTRRADGEPVLLRYVFAPLRPRPGQPAAGVVFTASDVTAEVQSVHAAAQGRLLGELSERINAAADPDRALQELTDALVPQVADVAAVYVTPADDRRPDAVHTGGQRPPREYAPGPAAMTVAPELEGRIGLPPPSRRRDEPSPWLAALTAGRPLIIEVAGGQGQPQLGDHAVDGWVREAGGRNLAVLPLTLAGELAGAVVLLAAGDRAPYEPADLAFLELVAARAGAAVTHLRGYRQQRQIALDLQHALLPAVPAVLPGVRVAARYVAGAAGVDVGGDWWDVHRRTGGRTGVGVGDVAGRGTAAAVVMGQARAAMRAAAHADLPPARLLELLDAQLSEVLANGPGTEDGAPPRFATAAYAVIDHREQRVRVANAGHPPMLVLHPDGAVTTIQARPGPPAGLGLGGYHEVTAPFPTGSTLAAFTDGLVESRTVDVDTGVTVLCEQLTALGGTEDLEHLADALLEKMGRSHGHDDDVALVLVHSTGAGH